MMKVAEFRELVDGVCDATRSLRSATNAERDAEACRVQRWVRDLRDCEWPQRLSETDRRKALMAMDQAHEVVAMA